MHVLLTLTYRPGEVVDHLHLKTFLATWAEFCSLEGIPSTCAGQGVTNQQGKFWWEVVAEVPAGFRVPHLDKAGMWPHGVTSVLRYRRQVGASSLGWSAGLSASAVTRPPESLTQARPSAPDFTSAARS